jgi:hypothetical protein|eukprot:COSAG01_NODE_1397_length_10467_cov_9.010706_4_plen_67_part_00
MMGNPSPQEQSARERESELRSFVHDEVQALHDDLAAREEAMTKQSEQLAHTMATSLDAIFSQCVRG